jgi:hypothetical protein
VYDGCGLVRRDGPGAEGLDCEDQGKHRDEQGSDPEGTG